MRRLGDVDLHLFAEGTHARAYERLGAHLTTDGGKLGVAFAVWAPNAARVSVIGDFEDWGTDPAPLQRVGESGIWAAFVPGLTKGTRYKYRIESRHDGYRVDKADPYAFRAELPPATASIVWDLEYDWADADWMRARRARNALDAPQSIYEVHLGSWMRVPEEKNRWLVVSGDRAQAGRARSPLRFHARRAAADRRAPVLSVLGLSGDRASSRPPPATGRRRTSCS